MAASDEEVEATRAKAVALIWGAPDAGPRQTTALKKYFKYFDRELRDEASKHGLSESEKRVELEQVLTVLKRSADKRRRDIGGELTGVHLSPELGVRLMYMTACPTVGIERVKPLFQPKWRPSETLREYLGRVYSSQGSQDDTTSIGTHKLLASYLKSYARIRFRWTDQLSDHLILRKGEDTKELYLFRYPAALALFLHTEASHRGDAHAVPAAEPVADVPSATGADGHYALPPQDLEVMIQGVRYIKAPDKGESGPATAHQEGASSMTEEERGTSDENGAVAKLVVASPSPSEDNTPEIPYLLPRGLLSETLATYELIFPKTGANSSWDILNGEIADPENGLDSFLLDPSSRWKTDQHNSYRDALGPYNVRSLYEKYPHWADRLYDLWCEADDPMPAGGLERWAESKRNPRFASICAMFTIGFAILFGISTTGLAAVQVWVGWCTWMDSDVVSQCRYKAENVSPTGG